ncbi:2-amino-4-hydroxy-6-hydroxymethyldihydropteridine diphosphokinase [bacterium]|nr:2-amino-4-hydroxy-6-hydroxymethyldihydropteridine diphosphokinase [bacterium]
MPRCYLGLGGNVGSVEDTLQQAYRLFSTDGIQLVSTSSILETPAVGKNAGAPFRNAAAAIDTDLPPLDLLKRLNQIESELGRERIVHWGPRTLDIDLLLYGDQIIEVEGLSVPHPACWYRSFVLTPLAEIAADVIHPVKQVSITELDRRIQTRPLPVEVDGHDKQQCSELVRHLSDSFAGAADVYISERHRAGNVTSATAPKKISTAQSDASRAPQAIAEGTSHQHEAALLLWCGGPAEQYDQLPLVPRLDVSTGPQSQLEAAAYAIQSAL